MKKITLIFFVLVSMCISAQDRINLQSGASITNIIIVSVNDSGIVYTGFSHPNEKFYKKKISEVKEVIYGPAKVIEQNKVIEENENALKTFHVGIIPYQIFSRSCGAYISKTFKGKFFLEYRPTYTIPLNFPTQEWTQYYDWFYYQGINNNLLLSFKIGRSWKFGLLLGYKIWWYDHKWTPWEGRSLSSDYSFYEEKSGIMNGLVGGFEFQRTIKGNKRDMAFFMNCSATEFTGKRTVYPHASYPYYGNRTSIIYERVVTTHFNVAIGFKFNITKRLKRK